MVTATRYCHQCFGYITQVIGPVIDAEFPSGKLPEIYNAPQGGGAQPKAA
jgi:F-type H+-transporting ATPase subunit beta